MHIDLRTITIRTITNVINIYNFYRIEMKAIQFFSGIQKVS